MTHNRQRKLYTSDQLTQSINRAVLELESIINSYFFQLLLDSEYSFCREDMEQVATNALDNALLLKLRLQQVTKAINKLDKEEESENAEHCGTEEGRSLLVQILKPSL